MCKKKINKKIKKRVLRRGQKVWVALPIPYSVRALPGIGGISYLISHSESVTSALK